MQNKKNCFLININLQIAAVDLVKLFQKQRILENPLNRFDEYWADVEHRSMHSHSCYQGRKVVLNLRNCLVLKQKKDSKWDDNRNRILHSCIINLTFKNSLYVSCILDRSLPSPTTSLRRHDFDSKQRKRISVHLSTLQNRHLK